MKALKLLCVFALVFAVSTAAYAETQAVKVSGDIAMRAFARDNYDLVSGDNPAATAATDKSTDWAQHLMSTTEIQIDADLTDNVSAAIRLVNQRVWGNLGNINQNTVNDELIMGINPATGNTYVTRQVLSDTGADLNDSYGVDVDLAYVELKEFLYSPLTLKIGRQDLWFGKGFIVGANLQNPRGALYASEYTAIRSFDAIRVTLDYDPWTIDGVYAKIHEGFRRRDDDINLWGINVGYVFDQYNAEAEAYWFFKQDRLGVIENAFVLRPNGNNDEMDNSVHTLGLRGSFDPIEDWTIALEGAYQTGAAVMIDGATMEREREAFAVDAMIECRYWQDDFSWRPTAALEYIFYSGEDDVDTLTAATGGDYNGWDPMYRGKFDTAIREWQGVFYRTAQNSMPAYTNQHQLLLRGAIEPTDSLTVEAQWGHFWLQKEFDARNTTVGARGTTNKNIGDEIDIQLTWDYTEDVSFNLLTAWFVPGPHFAGDNDDIATDIVGTVKLSF